VKRLFDLIAAMAASAEGCSFRPEHPWPLHSALVSLVREAHKRGLAALLPEELVIAPLPEAGIGVVGVEDSLLTLLSDGTLRHVGDSQLVVISPEAVASIRRRLLVEDPRWVRLVYRAARLWATEANTCEKKLGTMRSSWGPTVASGTPNPLHALADVR
jgi:hypothetical protein